MQERNPFSHNTVSSTEIESSNKYALISVYNKEDIVWFSGQLEELGYNIISTGGTAQILAESGLSVIPVEEITGYPEIFDGRIKSISSQIEGGILYDRTNPQHVSEAGEQQIKPIDIVVANFYPFEKTVENPHVALDNAIENIDVGGPTMIRAAAKNFKNVLVIVDPNDYVEVGAALKSGLVSGSLKQKLAARAFARLSEYDQKIAQYLWNDYKNNKS